MVNQKRKLTIVRGEDEYTITAGNVRAEDGRLRIRYYNLEEIPGWAMASSNGTLLIYNDQYDEIRFSNLRQGGKPTPSFYVPNGQADSE